MKLEKTNHIASAIASTLLIFPIALITVLGIFTKRSFASSPEIFFSEYIEGSSNNKALEIYNPTESAIDLALNDYKVELYFNGNTAPGLTINLSGSINPGSAFVLAHSSADQAILNVTNQTTGSSLYNGDDAIVLKKNDLIIDSIGRIGEGPGAEWGSGNSSTADNTLVRKCEIAQGDTNPNDLFDPSVEWSGFPPDTYSYLGNHSLCLPTPTTTQTPTPTQTQTPTATQSPTPTLTQTETPTPTELPSTTPIPSQTNGTIYGKKYLDLNLDHHKEFWEPTLSGWQISLYDTDKNLIAEQKTASGKKLGQYRFENLPKGTYFICEEMRKNWKQNEPDSQGENSLCWEVIIDDNHFFVVRNFGNIYQPEINYRFFNLLRVSIADFR